MSIEQTARARKHLRLAGERTLPEGISSEGISGRAKLTESNLVSRRRRYERGNITKKSWPKSTIEYNGTMKCLRDEGIITVGGGDTYAHNHVSMNVEGNAIKTQDMAREIQDAIIRLQRNDRVRFAH